MRAGNAPGPTNQLYLCPSYKGSRISTHWCYGYNGTDVGPATTTPPLGSTLTNGTPESAILYPSDLYAIADARLWSALSLPAGYNPYGVAELDPYAGPGNVLVEYKIEPHTGGRNIVFCDGHIEVVRRANLLSQSDPWAQRWFTDHQSHPQQWPLFATP